MQTTMISTRDELKIRAEELKAEYIVFLQQNFDVTPPSPEEQSILDRIDEKIQTLFDKAEAAVPGNDPSGEEGEGQGDAEDQISWSIKVMVTDFEGAPAAGVEVRLSGPTGMSMASDNSGVALFEITGPGRFIVQAFRDDNESDPEWFNQDPPTEGEVLEAELQLHGAPTDAFVEPPETNEPTLRKGDEDPDGWVEYLQKALNMHLNDAGESNLSITGKFDSATDQAVRWFQGAMECKVDGIVGNQTWSALREDKIRADIGTDDRGSEQGAEGRWSMESSRVATYEEPLDALRLVVASTGTEPINDFRADIFIDGARQQVSLGDPASSTGGQDMHVVYVTRLRERFGDGPFEIKAYLPSELGGDKWENMVEIPPAGGEGGEVEGIEISDEPVSEVVVIEDDISDPEVMEEIIERGLIPEGSTEPEVDIVDEDGVPLAFPEFPFVMGQEISIGLKIGSYEGQISVKFNNEGQVESIAAQTPLIPGLSVGESPYGILVRGAIAPLTCEIKLAKDSNGLKCTLEFAASGSLMAGIGAAKGESWVGLGVESELKVSRTEKLTADLAMDIIEDALRNSTSGAMLNFNFKLPAEIVLSGTQKFVIGGSAASKEAAASIASKITLKDYNEMIIVKIAEDDVSYEIGSSFNEWIYDHTRGTFPLLGMAENAWALAQEIGEFIDSPEEYSERKKREAERLLEMARALPGAAQELIEQEMRKLDELDTQIERQIAEWGEAAGEAVDEVVEDVQEKVEGLRRDAEAVAQEAQRMLDRAREASESVLTEVEERVRDAAEDVADEVMEGIDTARQTAEEMRDAAEDAANRAAEAVQQAGRAVEDAAEDVANEALRTAERAREEAEDLARRAEEELRNLFS